MGSLPGHRPSPAMVVALLALFVALGGTSYAVATGSIDSRELKNNTVRSKDIRNNNVRSTDVRNRSLLAKDFKVGQLPEGPQGRAGQDATKLFAYIRDAGSVDTATVQYGSGVTAVSDPPGHTQYMVTFDRSVVNCVVQAVPGSGDPAGDNFSQVTSALVLMAEGTAAQVEVRFHTTADPNTISDTAFLIAAFC